VTDWHRRRVEAAAEALSRSTEADQIRRAEAALRAADDIVYGVVPREEFEQLALDYSAMKVRAVQDEELLRRALEALDRIAAQSEDVEYVNLAFVTATELRALLAARADGDDDDLK
jgi:hypothetical protein